MNNKAASKGKNSKSLQTLLFENLEFQNPLLHYDEDTYLAKKDKEKKGKRRYTSTTFSRR